MTKQCIKLKLTSWLSKVSNVFSSPEPVPQGPTKLDLAMAKLAEQSNKLAELTEEWKAMSERHQRERDNTLTIQDLLDEEARLGNELIALRAKIRQRRLPEAPSCFGLDDCSTQALSTCAHRMDCGS